MAQQGQQQKQQSQVLVAQPTQQQSEVAITQSQPTQEYSQLLVAHPIKQEKKYPYPPNNYLLKNPSESTLAAETSSDDTDETPMVSKLKLRQRLIKKREYSFLILICG